MRISYLWRDFMMSASMGIGDIGLAVMGQIDDCRRWYFREGVVECGYMRKPTANLRELTRINANRIFLAFGCSAPAYRLRRNRTLSGKMLRKNRRAGFSFCVAFFF